ncbi:hypothetical protein [Halorubellus salinus]|nr:hypothetical protein [Halorubellus salinus]
MGLVLGHVAEDEYDARIQRAIAVLAPVFLVLAPVVSLLLQ